MARVREIAPSELPSDLASIYEKDVETYGPFGAQVSVIAHVPAALRHLMPMLMELRAAKTLPKRYFEIAIVIVSKLNECEYYVAMHKPSLNVEGISPEGIDRLIDYQDPPELDAVDTGRGIFNRGVDNAQSGLECDRHAGRFPSRLTQSLAIGGHREFESCPRLPQTKSPALDWTFVRSVTQMTSIARSAATSDVRRHVDADEPAPIMHGSAMRKQSAR